MIRLVTALCVLSLLAGCLDNTGGNATSVSDAVDRSNFVYVNAVTPEREARTLTQLDRNAIDARVTRERVQAQTLRASEQHRAVVYALYGEIPVGATVTTSYTYTRSKTSIGSEPTDKPFTQSFNFRVTDSTPIEPLIIVNDLFSVFKGNFLLTAKVNGQSVLQTNVPVTNDLPGLQRR